MVAERLQRGIVFMSARMCPRLKVFNEGISLVVWPRLKAPVTSLEIHLTDLVSINKYDECLCLMKSPD